jgi:hypothetical protein
MILKIHLDGDGCWPDLADRRADRVELQEAALLVGGMVSGKSSVSFRLELPGGKVVIAEQSLDQIEGFVKACRAREVFVQEQGKA